MLKILTICILGFFSLESYSQITENPKNIKEMLPTDVFIVEMNVDRSYSMEKIRLHIGKKKESFNLCRFIIDSVYYVADSTILIPNGLLGPKFVIVPSGVNIPKKGLVFASIFATSRRDVFVWSRFLPKQALNYKDLWYHAILRSVDIKSRKLNKYLEKNAEKRTSNR